MTIFPINMQVVGQYRGLACLSHRQSDKFGHVSSDGAAVTATDVRETPRNRRQEETFRKVLAAGIEMLTRAVSLSAL